MEGKFFKIYELYYRYLPTYLILNYLKMIKNLYFLINYIVYIFNNTYRKIKTDISSYKNTSGQKYS